MRIAELPLQTNALRAHVYGYREHRHHYRANSRGMPVEPLRIRVEVDFHADGNHRTLVLPSFAALHHLPAKGIRDARAKGALPLTGSLWRELVEFTSRNGPNAGSPVSYWVGRFALDE